MQDFSNVINSLNTLTIETYPNPQIAHTGSTIIRQVIGLFLKSKLETHLYEIKSNSSYNEANARQIFWQLFRILDIFTLCSMVLLLDQRMLNWSWLKLGRSEMPYCQDFDLKYLKIWWISPVIKMMCIFSVLEVISYTELIAIHFYYLAFIFH